MTGTVKYEAAVDLGERNNSHAMLHELATASGRAYPPQRRSLPTWQWTARSSAPRRGSPAAVRGASACE